MAACCVWLVPCSAPFSHACLTLTVCPFAQRPALGLQRGVTSSTAALPETVQFESPGRQGGLVNLSMYMLAIRLWWAEYKLKSREGKHLNTEEFQELGELPQAPVLGGAPDTFQAPGQALPGCPQPSLCAAEVVFFRPSPAQSPGQQVAGGLLAHDRQGSMSW